MNPVRQTTAWMLLGALAALSACQDTSQSLPTGEASGSVSPVHVTGAAASAVDADGHFVLGSRTAWQRRLLPQSEATLLGQVFVRRIASTNAAFYEQMHGAKIQFGTLQPCGRAYFAETPYVEPAYGVPESLTNTASPRWIVTYCEDGASPSMSVAIAASATYLSYEGPGFERANIKGQLQGMEFAALGVPVGKTMTPSPERAVTQLAEASGKRIVQVPVLVLPGMPLEPLAARWKLETEGPIQFLGTSGGRVTLHTVFVGRADFSLAVQTFRGLLTTSADPPETFTIGPNRTPFTLSRRSDMPRRFEQLEVAK